MAGDAAFRAEETLIYAVGCLKMVVGDGGAGPGSASAARGITEVSFRFILCFSYRQQKLYFLVVANGLT